MIDSEKVKYLANVFSIAAADGRVAPEESKVLQSVIARIEADAGVIEKARRMIVGGSFRLQGLTRAADRSQNLEDMVLVAMADGHLDETETAPIEKISDLLKMSQQEMDSIVKRAQSRLKSEPAGEQAEHKRKIPLPVRKRKVAAEPKEAVKPEPAEPKRPIQESKPVPPKSEEFTPSSEGITIRFEGAVGGTLDRLKLELGKALKSGEHTESGRTWYYGVWGSDKIAEAGKLAMGVFRLQKREAYVDGAKIDWNDLFGFCSCAYRRATSPDPETYCFGSNDPDINIWGCKKANMEWSEYADWFSSGRIDEKNKFFFDKHAIARRLEREMKQFCYCPHINSSYTEAVMKRFPASVQVWGHWKYRETDPKTPGAEMRTVRENAHGCSFSYDAFVDGIVPTDNKEAVRLIRFAARDCGLDVPALK